MARRLPLGIIAFILSIANVSGVAATTYTWNSAGTDWATGSNWTPNGGPGASDAAVFDPNGSAFGTTVTNPNISGTQAVQTLIIAPNQNMGGWTFGGSGSLTFGNASAAGSLTTYGPATYAFNGPTLAGFSATNGLNIIVGSSSSLVLSGNSAVTSNLNSVNVNSGTLILDNSGTNIPGRLASFISASTSLVTVSGSGTFELIGNAAGTTAKVGPLNGGSNVIGGVNTFLIESNGAATVLNFANSANGFTTRPGTRAVYLFQASTGNLGDASGDQVTFAGTPFLGANGLLSNTSGGGTVGFAIVKDAGGTDFATWNAMQGVVRETPTQIGTTAANLQSYAATDRVQFNPSTSTTATAIITNGSLRITPQAPGLSLTLVNDGATNGLSTNALMLDGANSFTILKGSGTSSLGGTGTRYVYVNNPNTTLYTDMAVANSTNPTVFAGPGFVDLIGTASQNTLTTTNRFVIAGGVVRANATQVGFAATGSPGIISLTGGILEIQNGSNGTGVSADFLRPLGSTAGSVTWGAGTANEQGSGGFSAYGSAASVNIGGAATPTTLQWNAANFVADGFALKFGSTQSNAVLNFLNPIQLDNGTNYELREINVTAGAGGDKTVMQGAISGASNADLVKTGTGILEFAAANSYLGNTLIQGGTLVVDNVNTGTGSYMVGSGATLRGTGTIPGSSGANGAIYVNSGGTLAPGGLTNTGVLTVNNGVTFTDSTSNFNIRANGNTVGNGTSTSGYDRLNVTSGTVNLNNATLNLSVGYSPNLNSDTLAIITATSSVIGNFNGLATNGSQFTAGGVNWAVYYNVNATNTGSGFDVVLVPVPEPAHIVLVCMMAIGAGYGIRKRWNRRSGEIAAAI